MGHMKIEDREIIEDMLKERKKFTEIGNRINYHRTTVADEIIKHRIPVKSNDYNNNFVNCEYEETCERYEGISCTYRCSKYKRKDCPLLQKPPYVCNGCIKRNTCHLQKYYYRAKEADKSYHETLTDSRVGLNIPPEVIEEINTKICPLIKDKKQTVNQVYINHPDILYFSKTEFYKLVNEGYLCICNIDLPRKVKYSKRKTKVRRTREESKIRNGRTYIDYQNFVKAHNIISTTELDTVEGVKGGKVLLTITITKYQLMLIYLLDKQDSKSVENKINWIKEILGTELYIKVFFCSLTDNGKEFYCWECIELINNEKKCHLFYCDPGASWQKGTCEVNHHYIRYILPKGNCTFDNLTQEDCDFIMSNIANIPREILGGQTPYESSLELFNEEQLAKLGITKIDKDDVTLSDDFLDGRGKR